MKQGTDEPPVLPLAATSVDEYCRSVLASGSEMWWFQTGLARFRGYSQPFQDRDGRWWWRGQVQFGWPVDLFTPLSSWPKLPAFRCALGKQYPVDSDRANSLARFNIIRDLSDFDISRVASNKRRAVRKGLRGLDMVMIERADGHVAEEVRDVWNSHVTRTGWNKTFDRGAFAEHFARLMDMPGTTMIGARDRENGRLCAWVLGRVVGDTVWVDTLASHTDRLDHRPNDTVVFGLLFSAARQGVRRANYFLKSAIGPLESFKQSMGFESEGIPARLVMNPFAKIVIKSVFADKWQRITGEVESAPTTDHINHNEQ